MGINKVRYAGGTLIDISNDTVTSPTLLKNITAHDADGEPITGTLDTDLKEGVLRSDAVLVHTLSYDKYVVDDLEIELPAYTTTATSLVATSTAGTYADCDWDNYDYFCVARFLTTPVYSDTTIVKGLVEYGFSSVLYDFTNIPPNNFKAKNGKTYTSRAGATLAHTMNKHFYWSSTTAVAIYTSVAYGFYQTPQTPSFSGTTITLKTPVIGMRGHSTYFPSAAWAKLTDFRCQYKMEIYRSPKHNLNLDAWGLTQNALHIINCVNNNGGVLT